MRMIIIDQSQKTRRFFFHLNIQIPVQKTQKT